MKNWILAASLIASQGVNAAIINYGVYNNEYVDNLNNMYRLSGSFSFNTETLRLSDLHLSADNLTLTSTSLSDYWGCNGGPEIFYCDSYIAFEENRAGTVRQLVAYLYFDSGTNEQTFNLPNHVAENFFFHFDEDPDNGGVNGFIGRALATNEVPELTSIALLSMGLAGFGWRRRAA